MARCGSLGKAGDGDADADVHACTLGLLCLRAFGDGYLCDGSLDMQMQMQMQMQTKTRMQGRK